MTRDITPLHLAEAHLAKAKADAAAYDRILDNYIDDCLHCMKRFTKAGYTEQAAIELTDITLGRRDQLPDY